MTATVSPIAIASSWSWVTKTAVTPLLLQQASHLLPHAATQPSIQIGEWFVKQKHIGLRCKRTRQRHTLLLSARQLMRHLFVLTIQTDK